MTDPTTTPTPTEVLRATANDLADWLGSSDLMADEISDHGIDVILRWLRERAGQVEREVVHPTPLAAVSTAAPASGQNRSETATVLAKREALDVSPALPREGRDAVRALLDEGQQYEMGSLTERFWLRDVVDRVPTLLDALDAAEAEIERLRAECDRAWDVAVEERLRRLEAQAGIESPPEPEPDPLAGRLPAQVEYGLVWDDRGSADVFPTLEQARAAARGLDEPAQVVRIETWSVADEGRAGA